MTWPEAQLACVCVVDEGGGGGRGGGVVVDELRALTGVAGVTSTWCRSRG